MTLRRSLQLAQKDENVSLVHLGPYLLLLIAAVCVLLIPHFSDVPIDLPPLPSTRGEYFSGGYSSGSYWVWQASSLACPLLVWLSYCLPGKIHDSRYFSLWLRFAGDSGQFFALLALEVATVKVISAASLYRQVLLGGYLLFVVVMIVRDLYLIIASNRLAGKMHPQDSEGG